MHPQRNIRKAKIEIRMQDPLTEKLHNIIPLAASPNIVRLIGVEDKTVIRQIRISDGGGKFIRFPSECREKLVCKLSAKVFETAAVLPDILICPRMGDFNLRKTV